MKDMRSTRYMMLSWPTSRTLRWVPRTLDSCWELTWDFVEGQKLCYKIPVVL